MKKLCVAILITALTGVSLGAAENSAVFMPLVQSALFTNRVQYVLAQEAPVVLTEAQTGSYTATCHTLRAALAVAIAKNPAGYANVFAVFLATNINVTSAGSLTGSQGTLDTPATDAALFSAVASLWSTVAGCVTNP